MAERNPDVKSGGGGGASSTQVAVITALIGAAATVTVAIINRPAPASTAPPVVASDATAGSTAAEPEMASSGAVVPAEIQFADGKMLPGPKSSDGGDETGHLLIRNYCDEEITVYLPVWLDGADAPATLMSWNYPAGDISRPSLSDDRVLTAQDGSIRFYARNSNYSHEWRGSDAVVSEGITYQLSKSDMGTDEQGRYLLDFTCS